MIRGRKLVLRIYLIGLGQIAALAATLQIAREANRPPMAPHMPERRFLVEEIVAHARDRASLQTRLGELKERTGIAVELRDRSGAVIASSRPGRDRGPGTFVMDWREGTALVHIPPPERPRDGSPVFAIAAVLVLVGLSAVLTAAWLGRPLAALSDAARELGQGNLAVRIPLRRNDELGDVAIAFNEMAGRVEHLVRGQRELLANVSHELRTPLARIRVALDLLEEGKLDTGVSLGGIASDLAELERLTNDILTSARLELSSAHPPLRIERTEARSLIREVAERFRKAHPARELRVQDESSDADLEVDAMLLRRALENLLDNAAKYSSAGVDLAASRADGQLTVEVRDQGAGMSAEDLASLFTPFFRADRSRARQTGGLGLGLLLARRIAEAHGGTLQIESAPGKGTVARLRVPIVSPA